ncbi:type II secretion system protein J [Anatilimnocola sp. NA78]|uniref:PulJ/GspJ family protein n=1 Tax=Anatilimnocola sp. NA78 TaxID=3415683 RepID=UPI003CE5091F
MKTTIIHHARRAFTLIELLIAMALTLILVYAIAEFYAYVGNAVRDSRAMIELGGQLRSVGQQLQDDLDSLTLRPEPWIDPNASPGYATFYEGSGYDADPDANGIGTNSLIAMTGQVPDLIQNNNISNLTGDGDDVVAMTIRAKDVPYQGRYNGVSETSQFAEVIWFTTFVDLDGNNVWNLGPDTAATIQLSNNELRILCRRLLLIRPDKGVMGTYSSLANALAFWNDNDVSARIVYNNTSMQYQVIANSLADLSKRENRFACNLASNGTALNAFPFGIDLNPNSTNSLNVYTLSGNAFGEDRVLSNVLAFDVRVFDPGAPIYQDAGGTAALVPGDPGYATAAATVGNRLGFGAWVDLYYNQGITREGGTAIAATTGNPVPHFAMVPWNFSYGVWDTWPLAYELPPYNTGRAFNGLDDLVSGVASNGVDDAAERETNAPYPYPLRGVKVTIRVYEPQTRQMRQVTVGTDFLAE